MNLQQIVQNSRKYGLYLLLAIFVIFLSYNVFLLIKRRTPAPAPPQTNMVTEITETEVYVPVSVINIGRVKKGGTAKASFRIINQTIHPLVITQAEVDCHCTVATWDKRPVPLHDSTTITASYDSSIPGFFQKKIFVYLNARNSPLLFILRGEITL